MPPKKPTVAKGPTSGTPPPLPGKKPKPVSEVRLIWLTCEEALRSYSKLTDTACITIDEHLAAHLEPLLESETLSEDGATFIEETVSGVLRHFNFCQATAEAYCACWRRNKHNVHGLHVLAYLTLYRFTELGAKSFSAVVTGAAAESRVSELLIGVTDPAKLEKYFIPKWRQVYDDAYVDNVICGALTAKADAVAAVRDHFTHLAAGAPQNFDDVRKKSRMMSRTGSSIAPGSARSSVKMSSSHTSAPGENAPGGAHAACEAANPGPDDGAGSDESSPRGPEFKLFSFLTRDDAARKAKSHRPPLPPPFEIRELAAVKPAEKFAPVPDRSNAAERAAIAAAKEGKRETTLDPSWRERNREKERAIPFVKFKAGDPERTGTTLPKLMAEKERKEFQARQTEYGPRPAVEEIRQNQQHIRENVDVRATGAALRREALLYERKHADEEAAIRRKEQEMRDDSEFKAWRTAALAADDANAKALVAQRRVDAMIADLDAKEAKEKQVAKNRHRVLVDKEVTDRWRAANQLEQEQKEVDLRTGAERQREELRENRDRAVQEIQSMKRDVAQAVRAAEQAAEQELCARMELEKARKQKVIEEIKREHARMIALVKEQRQAQLDRKSNTLLTGQLATMSFEELEAKLSEVKSEFKRKEEEMRKKINAGKAAAAHDTQRREDFVQTERAKALAAKERQRQIARDAAALKEQDMKMVEEQRLIEIQARLQKKRDEKADFQRDIVAAERKRKQAAQLLSADAGAVQRRKWAEIERGGENALVRAQNERLAERTQLKQVGRKEHERREANVEAGFATHRATRESADALFSMKRERRAGELDEDDTVLRNATAAMKATAKDLKDRLRYTRSA